MSAMADLDAVVAYIERQARVGANVPVAVQEAARRLREPMCGSAGAPARQRMPEAYVVDLARRHLGSIPAQRYRSAILGLVRNVERFHNGEE